VRAVFRKKFVLSSTLSALLPDYLQKSWMPMSVCLSSDPRDFAIILDIDPHLHFPEIMWTTLPGSIWLPGLA
jgi:hypothetical protein